MPVKIHNKDYWTVAERIAEFRQNHPDYSIKTELVNDHGETVIMKATISDKEGIFSTGYAEETRGSSQINQTSALENCETSAVGRALAFFGLAGTEIASADEVANAIAQQTEKRLWAEWAEHTQCVEENHEHLARLRETMLIKQWGAAREMWNEFPDDAKQILWRAPTKGGWFTTKERDQMKHFQELIDGKRDE